MAAEHFLPVDDDLIPSGAIAPVAGDRTKVGRDIF